MTLPRGAGCLSAAGVFQRRIIVSYLSSCLFISFPFFFFYQEKQSTTAVTVGRDSALRKGDVQITVQLIEMDNIFAVLHKRDRK
jgi:hypothetical protein